VIPLAAITQWRTEHAPWALDEQVEQDLIISRALVDLFSDPLIAATLVFRGGTALNKLYFKPAARYSEDIDLVQVVPGDIGPLLTAIRERLAWLGTARYKASEKLATLTFRFQTESKPVSTRKLKVEINTREHFSVEGLVQVPFVVASPNWDDYSADAAIAMHEALEENLTRIVAEPRIPDAAPLSDDVVFETLGESFELSGGSIKNAVLRAAYRAAATNQKISLDHFEDAAKRECQAAGKLFRAVRRGTDHC